MIQKILFSNIGYARGIDGSLWQYVKSIGRFFYCSPTIQQQVLEQMKSIIDHEQPDLCCFVEIDQGSVHSAYFNQMDALMDAEYKFCDISDKYGHNSTLGRMPLHAGKSNGFMSRTEYPFKRLYFNSGTKRLVYRIDLNDKLHMFFAHFSLDRNVRLKQFHEVHELIKMAEGEAILMADFNIKQGFSELQPLLDDTNLHLLNKEDEPTFTFHNLRLALDLCICSRSLASRAELRIIPQPFSDHDALLLNIAPNQAQTAA
jgi:endonuclease/exonuclease/phosphatase family metal-dependent hydrolase